MDLFFFHIDNQIILKLIIKQFFLSPLIRNAPSVVSWRRKWQPTPVFLPGKSHGQKAR